MDDKKQAENNVPAVDTATPPEKDLISSEDVLAVISGDQVALVEQMERAKEAALLQKSNAQEVAAEKAKKKLEEEEKKKKAIMDEVKRRKEEALRREQLAKEEAERKRIAAEEERKRQLEEKKRLEEEAKAKAEQERLEAEKKKQEKEAAIKAKEDAKKAKEQARLDAKKQKEQARLDAQKARQEAKEAAIKAKEDAKRARQEAKEAAKKAKIEARENAKKARLEAKKAKEQARKDAKSKQPVQSIPSSSQKISAQPSAPLPVVLPKKEVSSPSEIVKKPAEVTSSQMNLQPNPSNTSSKDKSKKDSNLKYYMTFIFLALLIWMVAFLPEISSFVSEFFDNRKQEEIPQITTGTLTCTMNTNDDKYDYYYKAIFDFEDSKMYRLTYSATTKGDQYLDAVELAAMKSSCDLLQQQTANSKGIDVSCSLSNGVYENVQKLDYGTLDVKDVTTAYLEAGGTYPNYKFEQNIDEIEKEMKASNYTCERQR